MKKALLALVAVGVLGACTGSYKSGNCSYDFVLVKSLSLSGMIDSCK